MGAVSRDATVNLRAAAIAALTKSRRHHFKISPNFRLTVASPFLATCRQTRPSTPPVSILKAHDIVLAEVAAGLYFDHFERDDAGVFQTVGDAERDVG